MACERERESIPCINSMTCPKCLLKQFDPSYELKISHRCCYELKKKPAKNYEKQSQEMKLFLYSFYSEENAIDRKE